MQKIMIEMVMAVFEGLAHNWFTLSLAILVVSILRAYINVAELKQKLLERPKVSILGSVAFGTLTPLCAAGTLGLIVGLVTTVLPWGPIMAFLTSSPLMSPDAFIMIAGVINYKFAVALATASILIGLGSGYLTHLIELKTDFLKNQTRFSDKSQIRGCDCGPPASATINTPDSQEVALKPTCCNDFPAATGQTCCNNIQIIITNNFWNKSLLFLKDIKWRMIGEYVINIGIKNMLLYFSIFIAVGFLVTRFVPTSIIAGLLGSKNFSAVPLAALIGLPLYITTEAAIPLVKALIAQGASQGAMLAFWIAGQTTSALVIAGLATFMKRKVISLYLFFVLTGAILSGYLFNLILLIWK